MNNPRSSASPGERSGSRRSTLRRVAWGTLYAKVGLLALVLVLGGTFYVRLWAGPVSLQWLGSKVGDALAERIGPNWTVSLGDTALVLEDGALALRASSLAVRNPEGGLVVRAPYALVSVETLPLLMATLQPRSIELRDLLLRASVNRDGSLSFQAAGEGQGDGAALPSDAAQPRDAGVDAADRQDTARASPVSAAMSGLFELIVDPANVVGALDRARVTNARLSLIAADGRERVAFNRVDASFTHVASRTRRFEMKLDGVHGPWRLGGQVFRGRGARREGTIELTDVPISDLLLLSGLSGFPAQSDLRLSGRAEASLTRGILDRLDARFETARGMVQIEDKDTSPIWVDSASVTASWDEAARRMALSDIHFKGGETELKLKGELTTVPGEPGWRLAVAGKDVVFSGASSTDLPLKVAGVEAVVSSGGRGLNLDRLALTGDKFSALMSGSYAGADSEGLRVKVEAQQVDVRTALRLWPEGIASAVRRFLVPNLQGGLVESLSLSAAMSPDEVAVAMKGGPVPEKGVKLDFVIRDGELVLAEGLPIMRLNRTEGRVTGTTTAMRATNGVVQAADGSALALSEGSFAVADMRPQHAVAQTSFRLTGGADNLVSLLQEPLLRSVAAVPLDPAQVKGRADLRINLALPLSVIPELADFPVTVSGAISDLSVEKAFGREKLEGANLAVAFGRGALNIRGDGRLSGTPAVIELRQTPGAAGELAVLLTLDDAARAKRGFSAGAQLSGPVTLRVGIPLAEGDQSPRIEIDLAKAAIDNVIPGWTKPAGRPGRVTFILNEGNPGDVRDLAVDSGTVQMRGAASFSQDGNFEKADITSLKFSQGDDLRAQVERAGSGYRVNVRGNVLDARPFLKSVSAAPGSSTSPRDAREVDLDLAVNIVSGFNDETLTNGSLKLNMRGRDLRQLQFGGRFRSAQASAQMTKAAGGPLIVIQSDDAGATLRFTDLYRRMVGGRLALQLTAGDGPQQGVISIDNFSLRNEPALRRIISQQPSSVSGEERGNMSVPSINPNDVQFVKLQAEFARSANQIEFRDATMWGMNVGFTIGGWIDYARDRTDISGTFVPAFGLNNVFSQVPVVGLFLGGGRNEGLFAVNFRVSGAASAPTLTVNPLSAVAPGFLRKFFGVGSPTDPGANVPPAALPPPAAVPSPPSRARAGSSSSRLSEGATR